MESRSSREGEFLVLIGDRQLSYRSDFKAGKGKIGSRYFAKWIMKNNFKSIVGHT
ncbi:hypothetical protein JCM16163A_44830 [Paenibacillus sp. YK5]